MIVFKVHARVLLQKVEDGRAVATAAKVTGQNQGISHGLQIGKYQDDSSQVADHSYHFNNIGFIDGISIFSIFVETPQGMEQRRLWSRSERIDENLQMKKPRSKQTRLFQAKKFPRNGTTGQIEQFSHGKSLAGKEAL